MRIITILLFSLVFFSCATSYTEDGFLTRGGFKEEKISNNAYEVGFYVNGYTSEEKANRYLLYRCAELTAKNGFKYFEIINQRFGYDKTKLNYGYLGARARIRMFNDAPTKPSEDIFNAKRFMMMNSDIVD